MLGGAVDMLMDSELQCPQCEMLQTLDVGCVWCHHGGDVIVIKDPVIYILLYPGFIF